MEFEDSTNFIYGILDYIFQIMDTEDVPEKQIMLCLALLLQGSENDIPTSSKNYIILWEKLKIIWKNPKWPWKLHPDFSEEGKEGQLGM